MSLRVIHRILKSKSSLYFAISHHALQLYLGWDTYNQNKFQYEKLFSATTYGMSPTLTNPYPTQNRANCYLSFTVGELEVKAYGGEQKVDDFAHQSKGKVISIPTISFWDAYGAFGKGTWEFCH